MSTMTRYVMGIDPGKKTGIAVYDLLTETMVEGYEAPWNELGTTLESWISTYRPTVVAEKFVINAQTVKNVQATWSLRGLGIAEFLAQRYGCPYAQEQAPSSAKRLGTDVRLDTLGWRVPGKGHLADAQRHVLLYLITHGWWDARLEDTASSDVV